MDEPHARPMEIESLNLSDTDVSVLDARLEMTPITPQLVVCTENCGAICYSHSGCGVDCTNNNGCHVDCLSNTGSGCNCNSHVTGCGCNSDTGC
jgi:hypothetical protein